MQLYLLLGTYFFSRFLVSIGAQDVKMLSVSFLLNTTPRPMSDFAINLDDYLLIIYFFTTKSIIKQDHTLLMIMVFINNPSLSWTMTMIALCSILFSYFSLGSNLVTLYQRTTNISSSNWDSATKSTKYGIRNVIDCAGKCQIRQGQTGDCNAFKFDNESDSCDLGLLTFLEDPGPGESSETIMMDTGIIPSLNMVCRGGERCCGPEDTRSCVATNYDQSIF